MATHPKEHQESKGEGMAAGEGDESTQTNDGGILPANFAEVVASLPQGPKCSMFNSLRQYRGFWLPRSAC